MTTKKAAKKPAPLPTDPGELQRHIATTLDRIAEHLTEGYQIEDAALSLGSEAAAIGSPLGDIDDTSKRIEKELSSLARTAERIEKHLAFTNQMLDVIGARITAGMTKAGWIEPTKKDQTDAATKTETPK